MHVRVDGNRLSLLGLEVGGHPCCHQEMRVEAHDDEHSLRPEQPCGLGVERCECREVLVYEAGDHSTVGFATEP
jgi:hypothetical protein